MVLEGKTIMVTGASGNMGEATSTLLAQRNKVYGVARFSDPAARQRLEQAGVKCIKKDLGVDRLDDLPDDVQYIINLGAATSGIHLSGVTSGSSTSEQDLAYSMKVNAYAIGNLMRRYPKLKGFVTTSTAMVYKYQPRPIKETDLLGVEEDERRNYSVTKIAGEAIAVFASEQFGIPAMVFRIFQTYSAKGGPVVTRVHLVAQGKEVPVYPNDPCPTAPLFITDFVSFCEVALGRAGTVPATIVNVGGTRYIKFKEYVEVIGRMMGVKPKFLETTSAHKAFCPDTTLLQKLLGKCEVTPEEGIRQAIQYHYPGRLKA